MNLCVKRLTNVTFLGHSTVIQIRHGLDRQGNFSGEKDTFSHITTTYNLIIDLSLVTFLGVIKELINHEDDKQWQSIIIIETFFFCSIFIVDLVDIEHNYISHRK